MNLHNALLYALVGLVSGGVLLVLDQIWLHIVPWDVFLKMLISIAILTALAGFLMIVRADFSQNKKLKDENYLD